MQFAPIRVAASVFVWDSGDGSVKGIWRAHEAKRRRQTYLVQYRTKEGAARTRRLAIGKFGV